MQPGIQGCGLPARLGACGARREGGVRVSAVTSNPRREALFDVDPRTGATIEVFYADRRLETFGRCGAGWFWCYRRRGCAPDALPTGPFSTSYAAYRHALGTDLGTKRDIPLD